MSHFTVLVIGDNVKELLQPFHEYECTGVIDQYVVELDETEEFQKEYQEGTTEAVKLSDGSFLSKYNKRFETSTGTYDYKGNEILEVPFTAVYPTFAKFMEGYHGYQLQHHPELKEGRFIRLTNPNKKWDWWVVGGRWTGFFRRKPGAEASLGRPGLQRMNPDYQDPDPNRYADQLHKRDVDLEGMREEARTKANETYDKFEEATRGLEVPPKWKDILERHGEERIEAAREEWHSYAWVKALQQADLMPWMVGVHDYYCVGNGGREAFVAKKVAHTGVTFAVVKEEETGSGKQPKWYEKGDMGWWGFVSDEKDESVWNQEFQKLLDSVPDDTLLTVVDCHI